MKTYEKPRKRKENLGKRKETLGNVGKPRKT